MKSILKWAASGAAALTLVSGANAQAVYYPVPTGDEKELLDFLNRMEVIEVKPEPGGATLEALNPNRPNASCALNVPETDPDVLYAKGPNGERLQLGMVTRIVTATGKITVDGCAAEPENGVRRTLWNTPNGQVWKSYKASALVNTPDQNRAEALAK